MRKHLSALQSEHDSCDVHETVLHIHPIGITFGGSSCGGALKKQSWRLLNSSSRERSLYSSRLCCLRCLNISSRICIPLFCACWRGVPFLIIYCSLTAIEPPCNLPSSKGILPTAVYIYYLLSRHSSNIFLFLHCIIITIK